MPRARRCLPVQPLVALASYVTIFAATAWLSRGWRRGLLAYLPVLGAVGLAVTGRLSELAVAREYANNAETFAIELRIYLFYVLGATTVGLLAGVTLGCSLAARRCAVEPLVFGTLNVLQVVPTLAFVGLLYPVLSALSSRFALFEALGVRRAGGRLCSSSSRRTRVYPIARNTYAGVANLDPAVTDAATGMGMGAVRRLVEVELPLALPVIIAGLRVALVQTTAGAIVAGLVGGGGLGTFVFLGVSETADRPDLARRAPHRRARAVLRPSDAGARAGPHLGEGASRSDLGSGRRHEADDDG